MGLGKTCCSGAILWDHRSDLIVDFCRNFFVLTHLWGSSFLCVGKKKTTSPFLLFLFSCYFLILIWWAEFIQWREHWLLEVRKGRQWVCLFWEQWTRFCPVFLELQYWKDLCVLMIVRIGCLWNCHRCVVLFQFNFSCMALRGIVFQPSGFLC